MLEKLIAQIMAGYEISKAEAKMLIDYDLGTLKQGAELIRRSYCGSTFDLCSIINGKSGRCSENCNIVLNQFIIKLELIFIVC